MTKEKPKTVEEYISKTTAEAQEKLWQIRAILKKVAPDAKESMKWGTPVFEEKRILFGYAAFKDHLNFIPTPAAMEPFKKDLAAYRTGKGTIQFSYDKPLPADIIRKIAAFRVRDVKKNDARWM